MQLNLEGVKKHVMGEATVDEQSVETKSQFTDPTYQFSSRTGGKTNVLTYLMGRREVTPGLESDED